MKYYNIGLTDELNVIGHYPQTKEVSLSKYHIDNEDAAEKVNRTSFPTFLPKYGIEFYSGSKQTDLIDRTSGLSFGLVVSEKLKCILEQFKLPPHRFYPIDVYNTDKKYYWFHYIFSFSKYCDMPKTEFELFNIRKLEIIKNVSFISFEEMMMFKRQELRKMKSIFLRYKSIHMTSDFPKYDVLDIQGAQYLTLFSEELKQRLEKEEITGLEYSEYDKVKITPTVV